MSKSVETYICSGCNIGQCIDINLLEIIAKADRTVTQTIVHPCLCSGEGIAMISKNASENLPDGLLIAACSARHKTGEFSFGENAVVERVDLRDKITWSQTPNNEDTQMLANDQLRMGLAKLKSIIKPVPYIHENISKDILVIGGGITGITAALEGAKAGFRIILIEKEIQLGGYAAKLYRQIPMQAPYNTPETPVIHDLIKQCLQNPNIGIYTNTSITSISGEPGNFLVYAEKNGIDENHNPISLKAGAIVLANGWKPYNANKLTRYTYGQSDNIITANELEEMMVNGRLKRPSGKPDLQSVVFIQCAGSRDPEHLPYCSNFCCATSLKQSRYIREIFPRAHIYIIYKDIRTPGRYEHFYQSVQDDDRLFLTKGEINGVETNGDSLTVKVYSETFNEDITIETDLVVLATGMTPALSTDLNLLYRQGKGLPELKYEFPDSHFICFPYETRRTGVYAAGAVRAPMDMMSSMEDATGAMLKAIQCAEATSRGEAVHPRSGDLSYPKLYMQRCTDCKRCTEECPFGSYDENEKGTPLPNPARCRRCGICLGACPERIINFDDFSINAVSEMIRAVEVPGEFEEKPRILAFVCENDAMPAFDMAGLKKLKYSPFLRIIPVRCIGSVNKIWISDALSHGYDGIMLFGCKGGDDYQCHFIQGSDILKTRGENIQETLDKMMLESERIRTVTLEINEYHKIPEIIEEYMKVIEDIGYNPFKE